MKTSLANPILRVLVLALFFGVLALGQPCDSLARHDMHNGGEGDPGDGFEGISGGGSGYDPDGDIPPNSDLDGSPIKYPMMEIQFLGLDGDGKPLFGFFVRETSWYPIHSWSGSNQLPIWSFK